MINLFNADMFSKVATFEDNSIDLVLTDFPYGISFMNKTWDKTEDDFFYKVGTTLLPKMKPGAFLVTTFTPRQDMLWRCLAGLERAGFSMKTSPLFWLYHSGFPKAMDVSKAIDKRNGIKRKVIGEYDPRSLVDGIKRIDREIGGNQVVRSKNKVEITEPSSDDAVEWDGWKSYSLKPSVEIIITVQKPLEEKTIVGQVLKNGHGAVNVEECRIPYANETPNVGGRPNHGRGEGYGFQAQGKNAEANNAGRFPANLIVEGEPLKGEITQSSTFASRFDKKYFDKKAIFGNAENKNKEVSIGDSGSPNRFYSLDAWAEKHNITLTDNSAFLDVPKPSNSEKGERPQSGAHPTIKPYTLYSYLCKMFGKKGWVVLDPFMGSGTTGIACSKMGMNFIGIEKEEEYFLIAKKRLKPYIEQITLIQEDDKK